MNRRTAIAMISAAILPLAGCVNNGDSNEDSNPEAEQSADDSDDEQTDGDPEAEQTDETDDQDLGVINNHEIIRYAAVTGDKGWFGDIDTGVATVLDSSVREAWMLNHHEDVPLLRTPENSDISTISPTARPDEDLAARTDTSKLKDYVRNWINDTNFDQSIVVFVETISSAAAENKLEVSDFELVKEDEEETITFDAEVVWESDVDSSRNWVVYTGAFVRISGEHLPKNVKVNFSESGDTIESVEPEELPRIINTGD